MGQLPPHRITPSDLFSTVGVDCAGLFLVKRGNPRKPVMVKNYLCVFVDFAVKAVYLELVTDLTAEAFVATLRRFVSRRKYFPTMGPILLVQNKIFVNCIKYCRRNHCKTLFMPIAFIKTFSGILTQRELVVILNYLFHDTRKRCHQASWSPNSIL